MKLKKEERQKFATEAEADRYEREHAGQGCEAPRDRDGRFYHEEDMPANPAKFPSHRPQGKGVFMNQERFDQLLKGMEVIEHMVLLEKGKEYTVSNPDRLSNFKEIAAELGISPIAVWYVYFRKHIHSIASFVKSGRIFSDETIEGRFTDARNYLVLGRALIEEMNKFAKEAEKEGAQ